MSYCLNPNCQNPENSPTLKFCHNCGTDLLLKERYRVIQVLGKGGFGRTFLAADEDKPSKPRCVIKQFFPQVQASNNIEKAAELFEQEALYLEQLGNHPQIPELLAYFTQDQQQYLVQEFIPGNNLAQVVRAEGALSETHIRQLLNSLLPVLDFIHIQNIIHRDIKPENIIYHHDGQLILVDFGAAKSAMESTLAKRGTVIGSAGYTAPEQAIGKALFASDLYSLGVTCIYLLTRVDPYELFNVGENDLVWRPFLTTPVSESLCQIIDKMVQPATKRRYQLAEEVYKDLNLLQAQIAPESGVSVPSQYGRVSSFKTQPPSISTQSNQAVQIPYSATQVPPIGWPSDAEVLAAIRPSALNYYSCQLEDQIEAMTEYIQELQNGNYSSLSQSSSLWKPGTSTNSLSATEAPIGWPTDAEVLAAIRPSVLNYYSCQLEDKIEVMNKYIQQLQTRCPQCSSAQLNFSKKGFSWGKATAAATVGAMALGPVGWVGGLMFGFNDNEFEITCLRCGHHWKPSKA